jgi:hypothetical protein
VILACLKKNAGERPSAEMLKNYSYFKKVKFASIFDTAGPIQLDEIKVSPTTTFSGSSSPTKKTQNEELFSVVL